MRKWILISILKVWFIKTYCSKIVMLQHLHYGAQNSILSCQSLVCVYLDAIIYVVLVKAGGTLLNFATIHWLLLKRCSNKSIALLNLQIWWTPSAFSHLKKLLPQSPASVACRMQKHWILTVKLTYSAHTNLFQPSFSHQKH